jgi:radical SAM superfamily enzyme YgiQ (UPF0313 family)
VRVKLILPELLEAHAPGYRRIKYALFPPLGLAGLAGYLDPDDEVELVDEHVQTLDWDDEPDLVAMTVYITSAKRAYRIADHYRARGVHVCLGGLHPTSLPDEAAAHADTVFIGPGEDAWPRFLADFRRGKALPRYESATRSLSGLPALRRDLIDRPRYLCPNSIVVSRGCPHHCDFCYKDAFYAGGRSFYTQTADDALAEIARLPGRHLYFLDDHLFGNRRFATALFDGMQGMGRVFQGASTVNAILDTPLIEHAADAGMRSVFVGLETLNADNLRTHAKAQNLARDYDEAIRRCHAAGVMVNASFVFGLDHDTADVFDRTVDWAVERGIETATFHIMTPYPGTRLYERLHEAGRITCDDWNAYDTRHVVYRPERVSPTELEQGYWRAYRDFYRWRQIARGAATHEALGQKVRHLVYAGGWKKFEPVWDALIRSGLVGRVLPALEWTLDASGRREGESRAATAAEAARPAPLSSPS